MGQIKKFQLQELIQAGAKEQDIQRLIKSNLSIVAELYDKPDDEYICFSEFPIGYGAVDFVVFSGRSRMDVTLNRSTSGAGQLSNRLATF